MRTVVILLLAAAAAFGQGAPAGPILTALDAFLPPPSVGGPPSGPGGPAVTAGVGGAGGILLHLTGSGFQDSFSGDLGLFPGSIVQWIGGATTTVLSPPPGAVNQTGTLLIVSIPASLIAQPGSVLVKVVNPGGATSVGLLFTINAFPTANALPAGTVGVSYSQPMITGGTGPFTVSVTPGNPPLSQTGLIAGSQVSPTLVTGTPTTAGTFNFSAVIVDAWGQGITPNYSVTIYNPLVLVTATLPNGTVNSIYSANLQATGGQSPYGWTVVSGALPAGLSLNALTGAITGTPTAAGLSTFFVQVADPGARSASRQFSITLLPPPLTITSTSPLPAAIAGVTYLYPFTATGGIPPISWSQISQAPIPGLTLSSAGVLGGIPTTPGNYLIGVLATAGPVGAQVSTSGSFTLVVGQTNLAIAPATLPAGTVGSAYSAPALSATGATAPYTWSITGGALPAGLSLNASTGAISGAPQSPGTANFTVQVADSSGQTATRALSIRVDPALVLLTAALPNATLNTAYTANLEASGGLNPHGWSITSGALPAGLSLNAATGAITGTPTVLGAGTFTAQVTDAAARTASRQFSIVVLPPPITITSTSPLPAAIAGVAYAYQFTAIGGVPPITWALLSETALPGLTFSSAGVLSGIPTTPGTYTFSVRASAGVEGQVFASGSFALVVGQTNLDITSLLLPVGTVGSPYSAQLTAAGATPPYTWSVIGGSLPLGLSLNGSTGAISGTPLRDGTIGFTVQVADSSGQKVSRLVGIDIVPRVPPLVIVTQSLPSGMVDQPYGAGVSANGGEPPYTWAISGLPPGLSAGSGGGINGTPTTPGTFSVGATVTDSGGRTASKSYSVVIEPPPLVITTVSPLGEAAVNAAYSANFAASGGIKPYSWALNGGSLPPGMSFAAGGVLSGKPVTEGTFDFSVMVSDSNQKSTSKGFRIVVRPEQLLITTGSPLTKGSVGQPYSAGFAALGGTPPYRWSGSGMPAGLALNAAGNLSGTPSAVGSATFSVEVADSTGAKASKSFELTILPELLRITTSAAVDGVMGAPYSQSFAGTGGTPPYRWAIVAGYAGAGLAMSADGVLSGRPLDLGGAIFIVQATDGEGATASRQFSMNITAPAIKIPTTNPPEGGSVGGAYSHTVTVDGAVGPVAWTATGLPPGITLGPDGTLSGTPTTPGTYPVTVTATDSAGRTTTETFVIVVGIPPLPAPAFAGLPDGSDPGRQLTVQLGLGGTYPMNVTGRVTLTFAPEGGGAGDPAVQFSTGGTTATFTIPAGSNLATFTVPSLGIQTGTVAGVITVTATFSAGGQDVTPSPAPIQTVRINRTPPVITDVRITRTATGFDVQITGYSSTREVRQAIFRFNAASGGDLQTTDQTVAVDAAFTRWYQDPAVQPFGSRFTFVQQFTLQGNAAAIASVQVTLTNGVGASNAVTANMP